MKIWSVKHGDVILLPRLPPPTLQTVVTQDFFELGYKYTFITVESYNHYLNMTTYFITYVIAYFTINLWNMSSFKMCKRKSHIKIDLYASPREL